MTANGRKKPPLVAERRPGSGTKKKTSKAKAKPKPKRKESFLDGLVRRVFGWIFSLIWRVTWRVGLVSATLVGLAVLFYASSLPPARDLVDGRVRGSVTLLDRDAQVFAWRGDQFGAITAETVSPHLKNAIIATEDKRFFWHPGIDPKGIASAIRINLSEGRGALQGHGGSTISQQTAKLLCLGQPYRPETGKTEAEYEAECRRGTLWRKAKEAAYALALEFSYTKHEILTIYLNRAFLGAGSRGFEAASRRYFGKSAAEVTAAEAAMLAGLLVAPSRYAPTRNLTRAQNRARLIVGLMEDQGYLTAAEAAEARANPAELSPAAAARAGGYFADWIMESGPNFFTKDTTEDVVIRTTFDQKIQRSAEEALQYVFQEKVRDGSEAQAAIVVMSSDGAVRAMVGGRKTKVSGAFNRATMALRQTGSSFKPFVYAAALDLGYTPNDLVEDAPITIDVPGSGPWSPRNYDGDFMGTVTLTNALMYSLNTPAVRVSEGVGRDNVRKVAEDFGIDSAINAGPALALGTSEATLLEMTGAYAGILNGGTSVTPYGILDLRLKGESDPLMGQDGGLGERVISDQAAAQLVYMMHQAVLGGTAQRAALPDRPVAGKTGTTQAARDAWFLGFTADYVAGVWMGYDDNTPLTGVTGGGLPAEIWHETMLRVHDDLPPRDLPMARPEAFPRQVAEDRPRRSTAEQVLQDVLGAILGRN